MAEAPDTALVYETLRKALEDAPYAAQLDLVRITDDTYAFLEAHNESLSDEEYLGLRLLLSQAEGLLTRYFGM